jgi:hypothetical protein
MDGQIIFICILVAVGLVVLRMVISRVIHKGANAIERAVRPEAAKQADNLIGTAVIFEVSASLATVRRAISDNVPVIDKIGHKMKVLEDSSNGISWALGLPSMGQGVVCVLHYKEQNGGTAAMFEITQHVTNSGVSPFVNQITELRNQVITAFKSAEPTVKITTDTQEVKYKMSWF